MTRVLPAEPGTHHPIPSFPKTILRYLFWLIEGFEDLEVMKIKCQSYFIFVVMQKISFWNMLDHVRKGDDAFRPQASVWRTWGAEFK